MKSKTLFLIVGLSLAPFSMAAETVKVGVALRFTPELNSFASSLYQGIELAQEEFNAKHKGLSIELVKYPHKAGHESVDQASKKIIEDKIKYVIGGEMSDEAFALAEDFHDKNILFMTPTASNPLLTSGNPLVFRACFSDDQVAKQMARYVSEMKNIHSIGVIHNSANAYSDYLTTDFLEKLQEMTKRKDLKVNVFRYAGEQPDFKTAVDSFKKANVDLVVAFTLQESLKSFYHLAKASSFTPLYVGSDGWGTNDSLLKAMPEFKGVRNSYWLEESKNQSVRNFKALFKKKNSDAEPNAWNAVAFDAAVTLFQAIEKAKNLGDPSEVAEILRTTSFRETVTGDSIRFNTRNTAIKPLYLYQISNSGSHFLKAIE